MKILKSPNDLVFGIVLIGAAAFFYWAIADLRIGTSLRMGPGYMPLVLCGLIGATGLILFGRAFAFSGEALSQWPLRPMACVLGGLIAFAALLEPAGLLIAMPLLVIIVSFGERQTRIVEVVMLAAALTLFSTGIFVSALRLPIPLLPHG